VVIAISSDHAGYELRRKIIEHLSAKGHTIHEYGAAGSEAAASYVSAGQRAAQDVVSGIAEKGIVICGTGLGISIVCNKHHGIRCALCTDEYMARMSRQHNDANMLALGARVVGFGLALSIVDSFLAEPFESGGRHQERVNEISAQEELYFKTP
jgi:ribose 5-phosphate isomerase B